MHAASFELTCADLHAFKPRMSNDFVADSPAVLIPSTARSATTDSAGSFERAALLTRRGDG